MEKRQLAAIMFTDIVGYTALMGRNSKKALELVRISKGIQKPLVEKHNGEWLKEMGDGALVKFKTALDAFNCAVEIQELARAKLDAKLRIGIHLGDITIEDNDVYGDGVNVASRLESIADPGGIYISESIEKAIQGQTDIQAKYLGEVKLKNVAYGVRTYAVQGVGLPVPEIKKDQHLKGHLWAEVQRRGLVRAAIAYLVVGLSLVFLFREAQSWVTLPDWSLTGLVTVLIAGFPICMYLAWIYERSPEGFVRTSSQQSWQNPYKGSQRKPLTGNAIIAGLVLIIVIMYLYPRFISGGQGQQSLTIDKSIAVLPFANDSPDPDNEYFCNGMFDEIITHLQKISELNVKSRTSVEQYRNPNRDIRAIAGELEVAYLVEGSVRKAGEDLRITAQLIDAKTGDHLWAETYDGKLAERIFDFQSNIAKKVATSLRAVITPDEEESINKIPTTNIAAYDYYIRAEYERWTYLRTLEEHHLKTAHDLFDKALQIDPDYLLAVVGKGQAFNLEDKVDSGSIYFDRAIALDPEFNRSYGEKGWGYWAKGEYDLALEYFFKAVSLPPQDEWWYSYHWAIGRQYLRDGDVIKALPYLRKGIEKEESQYVGQAYSALGDAYRDIGDYKRAEQYYRRSLDLDHSCLTILSPHQLMCIQGNFRAAFEYTDSLCQQVECQAICASLSFQTSFLLGKFKEAEVYFIQYQDAVTNLGHGLVKSISTRHLTGLGNTRMAYVFKQLGQSDEAEKLLNDQIERLQGGSNYHLLAQIYALQGDREKALNNLAQYAKHGFRYGNHDFILIDPLFERLRDDPEFVAIVKQAQGEKATLRAQVREMEERGELDL
jgi:TolB-like protein/class 3 adenylate cyclase/Tfp pilus assembly protein PilF